MSTKRIEFLQEKYPQISKEDFLAISACDTTPTKKYLDWLLRIFAAKKLDINNLQPAIELVEIHNGLKDDIDIELKDINRFSSVEDFMINFNKWLIKRFNQNEKETEYYKSGAELVFENDDIFIVKILSFEGSAHYGSKTKWCTNQISDYLRYATSGSGMYIVTTKTGKYTRHFSDKTQLSLSNIEFRNAKNETIDLLASIAANIELYKPFQKIFKGNSKVASHGGDSSLRESIKLFFNFSDCNSEQKKALVTKYGYSLIGVIDKFNYTMICDLFETFKDKVFQYIPESEDKNNAFVSVVEDGLKTLMKKGVNLSQEAYNRAVESFPENVIIVPTADDSMWRTAIRHEPWLINVSPFFKNKNVKELVSLSIDNPSTISFYDIDKIVPEDQRYKIAEGLLWGFDSYLEIFLKLKIKTEEYQLKLVEKNHKCLSGLIKPSTVVTDRVKELVKIEKEAEAKKKAELAAAKEAERKRREEVIKKDRENQKKLADLWGTTDTYTVADTTSDDMDWLSDFEAPKKVKPAKWGDVIRQFADGTYEIRTPDGSVVRAHSLDEARQIHSMNSKGKGW
jgi:hypothetical protein